MNVLFLTMLDNMDINSRGIYNDLMRRFHVDGHNIYIVCPVERRMGRDTYVYYGNTDWWHYWFNDIKPKLKTGQNIEAYDPEYVLILSGDRITASDVKAYVL